MTPSGSCQDFAGDPRRLCERGFTLKNKQRSNLLWNILGFLSGIMFLCAFSAFQKFMIGAVFSLKGFIIPSILGGISGLVITHSFFTITHLARQLKEQNQFLENQVKERTKVLQEKNKLLEKFSNIDALTSIANRRHFDSTLKLECARLSRIKSSLSLIMCDIDYFKQYNDLYGHQKGDECLQHIAGAIRSVARRAIDCIARYGGEEFAIILPGVESDDAAQLAETARKAVENLRIPHDNSEIDTIVTMSFGIASITSQDKESDCMSILVSKADKRLYMAKTSGRNRVVQSKTT